MNSEWITFANKQCEAAMEGGYRWFCSPNVVCLEKARRVRQLMEEESA
jgi:hypothetical protein